MAPHRQDSAECPAEKAVGRELDPLRSVWPLQLWWSQLAEGELAENEIATFGFFEV